MNGLRLTRRGDARALGESAGEKTALREQVGRSSGGERLEWAGRDGLWSARGDQPEANDHRPDQVHDTGVDGADRSGEEEDDVVVVIVVIETRNPHRVRRGGMGDRRKREQDAQQQDSEPYPGAHGPRPYAGRAAGARGPFYRPQRAFF